MEWPATRLLAYVEPKRPLDMHPKRDVQRRFDFGQFVRTEYAAPTSDEP
jgi:hypothetical protein